MTRQETSSQKSIDGCPQCQESVAHFIKHLNQSLIAPNSEQITDAYALKSELFPYLKGDTEITLPEILLSVILYESIATAHSMTVSSHQVGIVSLDKHDLGIAANLETIIGNYREYLFLPSTAATDRVKSTSPQITVTSSISLTPAEITVIAQMFPNYKRVVVGGEFTSGYSGSRVFWVQPIKDEVPELLTVIKIGLIWRIQQEWEAFETAVRGYWPHSVEIKDAPIISPDNQLAGLRYPLVGESSVSKIQTLHDACLAVAGEEAKSLLTQKLFPILDSAWQFCRPYPALPLHTSYDEVLPANLILEQSTVLPNTQTCTLSPYHLPVINFAPGDYVRLNGFVVSEINQHGQQVTLNLPQRNGEISTSYRLQLQISSSDEECFQVGQQIDGMETRVVETRDQLLRRYIQKVWPDRFDLSANTLHISDRISLPNPLIILGDILSRAHHVKIGHVHGDLHFSNVLVERQNNSVHLIDFANARIDHVMHDLICLETWVVTQMLPPVMSRLQLPAETIYHIYRELQDAINKESGHFYIKQALPWHQWMSLWLHHRQRLAELQKIGVLLFTIRHQAKKYLFDPHDWSEYGDGLSLYLLGILKRKGLEDVAHGTLAKQVAFLGAASIIKLQA